MSTWKKGICLLNDISIMHYVQFGSNISPDYVMPADTHHGPLSKRRGSEKKAYLGEMKAWLGSIIDICTSMCAYNMYYSGKLS